MVPLGVVFVNNLGDLFRLRKVVLFVFFHIVYLLGQYGQKILLLDMQKKLSKSIKWLEFYCMRYVLIITAHVGRLFHLDRYNTLPIQLQVNGVKGPSWLSCLRSFNFINGMSVEYMHCALLGVSKLLLSLWTDSARCSNTIHDIRHAIQQLDNRINRIKVTSSIRRKPRGISDLKHWKG